MVKVVILTLFYPTLVTQGIRHDFEGCMNLIKKINQILQTGLKANLSCSKNERVSEISYKEIAAKSCLRSFIRHYHQYSNNYDITNFFEKDKLSKSWFKMDLTYAFAYGNVVEFAFDTVDLEKLLNRLDDIDSFVLQLFDPSISKKIYEMYLDSSLLAQQKEEEFFLPPIPTVLLVVIVTETTEEFQKVYEIGHKIGVFGKTIIEGSIAFGNRSATNFITEPFFNILINPVLVNLQMKNHYKFADALRSILYLSLCIGELYNIMSIIGDAHELCVIARYSIPTELFEKIGKIRINPIRDIASLYGLRKFKQYEKIYYKTLIEDVNYLRSYGTKASEIIWRKEGVPHFLGIADPLNLIDSYIIHEPDKVIFKTVAPEDFVSKVYKRFEKDFEGFMESLNELLSDINSVIESSRTTIQLNIAIITLFWTLLITIILSREVFAILKSSIGNIWRELIKALTNSFTSLF